MTITTATSSRSFTIRSSITCGRLRVERRAGLVEQQHLGLGGERPRDAEPLLLAAGEPQRRVVEVVFDLLEEAGAVEGVWTCGASAFLLLRREPCSRRT